MHRIVERKPAEALAVVGRGKGKDPLVIFAEWTSEALRPEHLSNIYGEKGKKALPAIAVETVTFIERQTPQMADLAQKEVLPLLCARIRGRAGVADKARERMWLIKSSGERRHQAGICGRPS
jgi:hypothetical protein